MPKYIVSSEVGEMLYMGVDWGEYFGTENPDEIDAIMCGWNDNFDDDYDPEFEEFAEEQIRKIQKYKPDINKHEYLIDKFEDFELSFFIVWFKDGKKVDIPHEEVSLIHENGQLYVKWHDIRNKIKDIKKLPAMIDFMVDWDNVPCDNGQLVFTSVKSGYERYAKEQFAVEPGLLEEIGHTINGWRVHTGYTEYVPKL